MGKAGELDDTTIVDAAATIRSARSSVRLDDLRKSPTFPSYTPEKPRSELLTRLTELTGLNFVDWYEPDVDAESVFDDQCTLADATIVGLENPQLWELLPECPVELCREAVTRQSPQALHCGSGMTYYAVPIPGQRDCAGWGFVLAHTAAVPAELIIAASELNWSHTRLTQWRESQQALPAETVRMLLNLAWDQLHNRVTTTQSDQLRTQSHGHSQTTNRDSVREQEQMLLSIVRSFVSTLDAKDSHTRGHSERVALIARRIGEHLNLSTGELEDIYLSGMLHDIGKIGVNDSILRKAGKLTEEEFAEVKRHPVIGYQILLGLRNLQRVLPGVRHHHEAFDGSGYPDGLAGETIPLMARILAVADSFDAMASHRPYRSGKAIDEIEADLRDGAGTQWDKNVVDAYFAVRDDIQRICALYEKEAVRFK